MGDKYNAIYLSLDIEEGGGTHKSIDILTFSIEEAHFDTGDSFTL